MRNGLSKKKLFLCAVLCVFVMLFSFLPVVGAKEFSLISFEEGKATDSSNKKIVESIHLSKYGIDETLTGMYSFVATVDSSKQIEAVQYASNSNDIRFCDRDSVESSEDVHILYDKASSKLILHEEREKEYALIGILIKTREVPSFDENDDASEIKEKIDKALIGAMGSIILRITVFYEDGTRYTKVYSLSLDNGFPDADADTTKTYYQSQYVLTEGYQT